MNTDFESFETIHPEKFRQIRRDVMVDVYGVIVNRFVSLNFGEGNIKLGKVLTEPDLDLVFMVKIPDGVNNTKNVKVQAVDFEDDLFLGVEELKDI